MKSTIFAFLGLIAFVNGQAITELQVKTSSKFGSGMTVGSVDMDFINKDYEECWIVNLNNAGNTFQGKNLNTIL